MKVIDAENLKMRKKSKKKKIVKKSKKKFTTSERMADAKRWLKIRPRGVKSLVTAYSKRYKVKQHIAENELMQIGWYDEVMIEYYERNGIEWEYRHDGYSGDTKVVPVGTENSELCYYL